MISMTKVDGPGQRFFVTEREKNSAVRLPERSWQFARERLQKSEALWTNSDEKSIRKFR
jgi:hypothetical protein